MTFYTLYSQVPIILKLLQFSSHFPHLCFAHGWAGHGSRTIPVVTSLVSVRCYRDIGWVGVCRCWDEGLSRFCVLCLVSCPSYSGCLINYPKSEWWKGPLIMFMESMGEEFGQSAAGTASLCSTVSGAMKAGGWSSFTQTSGSLCQLLAGVSVCLPFNCPMCLL